MDYTYTQQFPVQRGQDFSGNVDRCPFMRFDHLDTGTWDTDHPLMFRKLDGSRRILVEDIEGSHCLSVIVDHFSAVSSDYFKLWITR